MAGILADVLLERLATLALDKIERELKLVVDVKQEIKNLISKLEAIQAVLEDAEQRQVMEANVKHWLNELNDVSFDMDDVLDEWITRVMKHQLEKQEKQSAKALVSTKKVCFPCPSSCFRFGQVNYQLFLRHEIAVKIQELNNRLALIDQNKTSFNFQTTTRAVPQEHQRSKTTSLPNIRTFGRDKEKNLIVSKLLSESSQGKEVPLIIQMGGMEETKEVPIVGMRGMEETKEVPRTGEMEEPKEVHVKRDPLIIPIVGMGGMGKTTLAQLVYNDEDVKSHFDKRIWVCVSDPFEEIQIAKAIIEGLDINNASKNSNVLETLSQCIGELLKDKKYLLVLDDVWNPNSSQWEELIKPLQYGTSGSRILVTTRNENVAALMKATKQMIPLKELSETFCKSLFYYNADIDERRISKEFKDIGLEIVKRCNGLPLAAKTLGSLMRNKETIQEWQTILKSKTWELKEVQQDVFRPLLLSYHDLSLATKRCLLYCGIFLKDHVYDMNNLIELWMSQDYLNVEGSNDKMIVGQTYFQDLAMRSFFQEVKVNDENGNITCKIHDIVHDFLQYLAKNDSMILNFNWDVSKTEEASDNVRHLTVVRALHRDYLVRYLLKCKRLRTITAIDSSSYALQPLSELKEQLKCHLRTIILRPYPWVNPSIKIPESIGGFIHLRYLDLSGGGYMEELPSAIGSLYNLQTLRLVGCDRLTKVDVGRLISLRHLYVEGCDALRIIKGIERLTQLQRLDWFRVRYDVEGNKLDDLKDLNELQGNKLEDLKDLNQLQGSLTVSICGNPKMAENAAFLVNKPHLLELTLAFIYSASSRLQPHGVEFMNGLEPHPGLNSLSISEYTGGVFSHWLWSLNRLRFLTLRECPFCESFPPLGKLASLESLRIERLDKVSKVGVEFLGIEEGQTSSSSTSISFPKLKKLEFYWIHSWEEWEGVEKEDSENNITIMPCLSELTIEGCKKLKALPHFLWKTPLQKLHISESPILQDLYREKNR